MTELHQQIDYYIDYCKNAMQMEYWTITSKKSIYKQFENNINCKDIREFTLVDYNNWVQSELDRGSTPQKINGHVKQLRALFNFYEKQGYKLKMTHIMFSRLRCEKKERVYYSREQINEVIAKTEDETANLMIRIAFDTGMRLNELRNLKPSSFQGDKVTYTGKGKAHHVAYLRPETVKLLKRYLHDYDCVYWLWAERAHKDRPLSCNAISKRMRKAFYACGYDDFYPHSIRHSYATDLQRQGATTDEIRQLVGHSSILTTEVYMHGFTDLGVKELAEKFR